MQNTPATMLKHSLRKLKFVGFITILVCFVGLGSWASVAPLSSAAIAPGQISPDGSQRIVQHLEGGIIHTLFIKEGDHVKKGQPLIILDKAQAQANYQSKRRKLRRLLVVRDRLKAQETGKSKFVVKLTPEMRKDLIYIDIIRNEISTFNIKRQLVTEQDALYNRQIRQVRNEVNGLKAQSKGLGRQLYYINLEIRAKQTLLKRKLVRKPDIYVLERKKAELSSKMNEISSTIARAEQKIEEIRVAKLTLKTEALDKVAEALDKVNSDLLQVEESLNATDDILNRTDIVSPIEGRILKLNYKTIGGIVRPGEPILTIVPAKEELIVDARLSPTDIDNVSMGMKAKIQLSSFMARYMLPLNGEIIQVGADVVTDNDTREKYYPLRVRVNKNDLKQNSQKIRLQPGMPAEVFVQTGSHTPLRYLVDPILKSFNRAFREEVM